MAGLLAVLAVLCKGQSSGLGTIRKPQLQRQCRTLVLDDAQLAKRRHDQRLARGQGLGQGRERRLDNGDFFEFLSDVLDEWGGDDADELFELLETQLGDIGVDLKYAPKEGDDEDEDEADDDDDDEDEDEDDDELEEVDEEEDVK